VSHAKPDCVRFAGYVTNPPAMPVRRLLAHGINSQLRKAPHRGKGRLGTSCHLAERRPVMSKPKIFLQRVGEA
jgi:hypothetical protein